MSSSGEDSDDLSKKNWPEKKVLSLAYEGQSSDSEEPGEDSPPANRPSTPPKKAKAASGIRKVPLRLKNPPFIEMIVEAVEAIKGGRKGVTVPAIKASMRSKHSITEASMKTHFKKQLGKAVEKGILIRPQQYMDSKGLVGRFKLSPEYLNAKQKSSKKKPAAAKTKTILQRKRRSKAPDVNTEKLTSLKETSVAAKAAKEKIKKARKSIGLSNTRKPKAAPKKKTTSSTKKGTSDETTSSTKKETSDGTRAKSKSAGKRTTTTVAAKEGESSKAEKLGKPKPKKTSRKEKK